MVVNAVRDGLQGLRVELVQSVSHFPGSSMQGPRVYDFGYPAQRRVTAVAHPMSPAAAPLMRPAGVAPVLASQPAAGHPYPGGGFGPPGGGPGGPVDWAGGRVAVLEVPVDWVVGRVGAASVRGGRH